MAAPRHESGTSSCLRAYGTVLIGTIAPTPKTIAEPDCALTTGVPPEAMVPLFPISPLMMPAITV